ncbi:hypothetical protein EYW98_21565 [Escherichia coli]|nr:hypothetical protein [Escherichia coli]EGO8379411.1 hypothetical protein [Escherichia coli]
MRTSPFAVKEPCYSNAAVEKLSLPTQDSRDIIAAACRALNHVWREGCRYMKAGVMLADFTPSGIAQPGKGKECMELKQSKKKIPLIKGRPYFLISGHNSPVRIKFSINNTIKLCDIIIVDALLSGILSW